MSFFNFRYITPEKFYVEALGDGKELLVIDRVSQEILLQGLYFFISMVYVSGSYQESVSDDKKKKKKNSMV
jgi:hypothetical protein